MSPEAGLVENPLANDGDGDGDSGKADACRQVVAEAAAATIYSVPMMTQPQKQAAQHIGHTRGTAGKAAKALTVKATATSGVVDCASEQPTFMQAKPGRLHSIHAAPEQPSITTTQPIHTMAPVPDAAARNCVQNSKPKRGRPRKTAAAPEQASVTSAQLTRAQISTAVVTAEGLAQDSKPKRGRPRKAPAASEQSTKAMAEGQSDSATLAAVDAVPDVNSMRHHHHKKTAAAGEALAKSTAAAKIHSSDYQTTGSVIPSASHPSAGEASKSATARAHINSEAKAPVVTSPLHPAEAGMVTRRERSAKPAVLDEKSSDAVAGTGTAGGSEAAALPSTSQGPFACPTARFASHTMPCDLLACF